MMMKKKKKKKMTMTKSRFCRFPYIPHSDGPFYFMDKRPLQKHSKRSKSLKIQAFERLEAFKMYYAIGASESSQHRESTDSLIRRLHVLFAWLPNTMPSLLAQLLHETIAKTKNDDVGMHHVKIVRTKSLVIIILYWILAQPYYMSLISSLHNIIFSDKGFA